MLAWVLHAAKFRVGVSGLTGEEPRVVPLPCNMLLQKFCANACAVNWSLIGL